MTEHTPRGQAQPAMSAALAAAFADERPWAVAPQLAASELEAMANGRPSFTPLQAQLLANRGMRGAAAARGFLAGEWRGGADTLPNLAAAVTRLRAATQTGERIVVFGDYDSDGMTSCAILLLALRALGAQATPYIPRRDDDGRGLNLDAVNQLAAEGAQLIVTTDCGSANVAEVARAHELGIEVIVTDHHPPYGATPDCLIVNPQRRHADAPATSLDAPTHDDLPDLSGAGVAFYVAEALLMAPAATPTSASDAMGAAGSVEHDAASAAETLESLLDLVAIGTVGDVVPLTARNWALAHAGLERLRQRPRLGLRALLTSAGIAPGQVTERDIAFAVAPRLNAAARLGEPLTALSLLISGDEAEARQLAAQLEALNRERQRLTDEVMTLAREQALAQLALGVAALAPGAAGNAPSTPGTSTTLGARPAVVFVVGEGWPLGIIGLVAGRLVDEFGCAAVALSREGDECRGSARGPAGVNLVAALAARPEFFRRFGGHARAAGFTIAITDLAALQTYLAARLATPDGTGDGTGDTTAAAGVTDAAQATQATHATEPLAIDCRLPLDRVTLQKYTEMRRLAPFGAAFAEPRFLCVGGRITRCWRSGVEGRNLRLAIRDHRGERVFLWSRQGALCDDLRAALPRLGACDVAYTFDAYQRADGALELAARIVALRPAAMASRQ